MFQDNGLNDSRLILQKFAWLAVVANSFWPGLILQFTAIRNLCS